MSVTFVSNTLSTSCWPGECEGIFRGLSKWSHSHSIFLSLLFQLLHLIVSSSFPPLLVYLCLAIHQTCSFSIYLLWWITQNLCGGSVLGLRRILEFAITVYFFFEVLWRITLGTSMYKIHMQFSAMGKEMLLTCKAYCNCSSSPTVTNFDLCLGVTN